MSRSRAWCFTLNNYTTEETEKLEETKEKYRYIVYGRELAPTTGTPHLQGYVAFNEAKTMSSVKKITGCNRLSLRPAKGTATQNRDYCSKEDSDFVEHGIMPTQGQRTDLNELATKILSGETTEDKITEENPMAYHQYGRTLNKLQDLALRKQWRKWKTKGLWIQGLTGRGKSHIAFKGSEEYGLPEYHPDTHYIVNNDHGWWDGYTGQEYVIINEFRGEIKYKDILEIIDEWPKNMPRRGREPVPILAKTVIITSSELPHQVYNNLAEDDKIDQLLDRIKVIQLKGKNRRIKSQAIV